MSVMNRPGCVFSRGARGSKGAPYQCCLGLSPGEEQRRLFLCHGVCGGGDAAEGLIKRSGQLEVKLALEIVSQVAAGLEAVDKQKLVHRDIKPSNIMVRLKEGRRCNGQDHRPWAGEARTRIAPAEAAISIPGAFAGTPEFASPEQFAGVGVDIRSDLYSLGVTLWEMLAGRTPFRGTPGEVMYQHQHAPLPLEHLEAAPQPVDRST